MSEKIIHVVVATNEWEKDGLRYRRHRLAEFLNKQEMTEEVIWLCPSSSNYKGEFKLLGNGVKQYGLKDVLPNKAARFCRYNDSLFYSRELSKLSAYLTKKQGKKYVWYTFPGFPKVKELLKWEKVMYDCSDLWAAPIAGSKNIVTKLREGSILQAENQILERADVVYATSDYLGEKVLEKRKNAPVHVIENGVEFEKFLNAPPLTDSRLLEMKRPILGYIGGIKPKIDFSLIKEMALNHKQWNFVFIGPDATNGDKVFKEIQQLPNVHSLGSIDPEEVPAYMKHLDAGILPYKESIYNKAVFPLKLFEYLAVGVPIVGMGLPSTTKYEKEGLFYYAHTKAEFIENCEKAVSIRYEQEKARISYAEENDWDEKFGSMLHLALK
ncbi:glycosyltransferase [Rossellomorea vietnamensis]|uniref:glycosyltransferase n=1 Tax=Rossellomorea vietnamensis TaxID=218284 RepID=UPI003CF1A8AE